MSTQGDTVAKDADVLLQNSCAMWCHSLDRIQSCKIWKKCLFYKFSHICTGVPIAVYFLVCVAIGVCGNEGGAVETSQGELQSGQQCSRTGEDAHTDQDPSGSAAARVAGQGAGRGLHSYIYLPA